MAVYRMSPAVQIGIVIAVLSGLITGFTTMFVVPIMLIEERGIISSWRRFWPTMTGQWKQYLVYLNGSKSALR